MLCQRCQGLMILERLGTRRGILMAGRCVNCGNVVDPVILRNRMKRPCGGTQPGTRRARPPSGPGSRKTRIRGGIPLPANTGTTP